MIAFLQCEATRACIVGVSTDFHYNGIVQATLSVRDDLSCKLGLCQSVRECTSLITFDQTFLVLYGNTCCHTRSCRRAVHLQCRKKMKVGAKRYEARSRGRSSPDSLAF